MAKENTENPPFDDHALADCEFQWLATIVAGVELAAIACQCAAVVDVDGVPPLRLARALLGLGVLGRHVGRKRRRRGGEKSEEREEEGRGI